MCATAEQSQLVRGSCKFWNEFENVYINASRDSYRNDSRGIISGLHFLTAIVENSRKLRRLYTSRKPVDCLKIKQRSKSTYHKHGSLEAAKWQAAYRLLFTWLSHESRTARGILTYVH